MPSQQPESESAPQTPALKVDQETKKQSKSNPKGAPSISDSGENDVRSFDSEAALLDEVTREGGTTFALEGAVMPKSISCDYRLSGDQGNCVLTVRYENQTNAFVSRVQLSYLLVPESGVGKSISGRVWSEDELEIPPSRSDAARDDVGDVSPGIYQVEFCVEGFFWKESTHSGREPSPHDVRCRTDRIYVGP